MLDKPGLSLWQCRTALDALKHDVLKQQQLDGSSLSDTWLTSASSRAANAGNRIASKAAGFGTAAHAIIDNIIRGQPTGDVDKSMQPVVDGFQRWRDGCGLQLLPQGDTVVHSHKYEYGPCGLGRVGAVGVACLPPHRCVVWPTQPVPWTAWDLSLIHI